ncbi:hypothetical protein EJB05_00886, partial [Eragrostis curvula]
MAELALKDNQYQQVTGNSPLDSSRTRAIKPDDLPLHQFDQITRQSLKLSSSEVSRIMSTDHLKGLIISSSSNFPLRIVTPQEFYARFGALHQQHYFGSLRDMEGIAFVMKQ